MSMSDPISDMLTRIRNAQLAEKVADLRQLNRQVTTAFAKVIQSGGQELDLGDKKVTAALQAALANMALPPGGRARMH